MNNGNSNDRLDRIERTLEQLTLRYESIAKRDEITAIRLERLSLEQEEQNRKINQARAIAESNSRTIQGILEQRATDKLEHDERMARLEENLIETRKLMAQMTQTQQGLTQILIGYDQDQPTILRRLMAIENKVDQILDRNEER